MQGSIRTLSQKNKEVFQEKAWEICIMYKEKSDIRTQKKIPYKIKELSEYSDKIPYLAKNLTYYDLWNFYHPIVSYEKSFKYMNKKEFQKLIEENLLMSS